MGNCAGIDWVSEKHDVLLIEDPAGEKLLAATFAHSEDGISGLCAALACFEVDLVAVERSDGLLVDRLLEAGVRVLALHPNQVKAGGIGFAPRAASRMGLIASCCVSWRELTLIASGCLSPTTTRPRRCAR